MKICKLLPEDTRTIELASAGAMIMYFVTLLFLGVTIPGILIGIIGGIQMYSLLSGDYTKVRSYSSLLAGTVFTYYGVSLLDDHLMSAWSLVATGVGNAYAYVVNNPRSVWKF